jgi:Protein of unknown function (DUF3892)
MVYVTAVHLSGGSSHEHISEVRWVNSDTGVSAKSTTEEMVEWLAQDGNDAQVGGDDGPVDVVVVTPEHGAPYLRTEADGDPTDNLLALPTF